MNESSIYFFTMFLSFLALVGLVLKVPADTEKYVKILPSYGCRGYWLAWLFILEYVVLMNLIYFDYSGYLVYGLVTLSWVWLIIEMLACIQGIYGYQLVGNLISLATGKSASNVVETLENSEEVDWLLQRGSVGSGEEEE